MLGSRRSRRTRARRYEEVGQLAWQLRPSILDDLGLVAALDALFEGIDEHAEVELRRRLATDVPSLEPEVELAIFRIGQKKRSRTPSATPTQHVSMSGSTWTSTGCASSSPTTAGGCRRPQKADPASKVCVSVRF